MGIDLPSALGAAVSEFATKKKLRIMHVLCGCSVEFSALEPTNRQEKRRGVLQIEILLRPLSLIFHNEFV